MVYKEEKDPLTGKGRRHTSSAISSTLGLTKAIIIEPEEEIIKDENVIPADYWYVDNDIFALTRWEANLEKHGIGKGDITLVILALRNAKDDWDITYYWAWKKHKTTDSSHFDFATIKHFKKVADNDRLKIMEEIKANARLDDYKQIEYNQREKVLAFLLS